MAYRDRSVQRWDTTAIRAAVALGEESDNAMLHCIDTALVFQSTTSAVRHGLVGVPMQSIRIGLSIGDQTRAEQDETLPAHS